MARDGGARAIDSRFAVLGPQKRGKIDFNQFHAMMVEHSQDDEIRIALEVPIAALVQV